MLQLTALDEGIVLDEAKVRRIKYLLLQFIPARRCDVHLGPGVKIVVPGHGVNELAPGIRAEVESTLGCAVVVAEFAD